jgi:hypothetical protein
MACPNALVGLDQNYPVTYVANQAACTGTKCQYYNNHPAVVINCLGGPPESFPVLGYDSTGLPIFTPQYVGNACEANDIRLHYFMNIDGELRFDNYGTLLIGGFLVTAPDQETWTSFDWTTYYDTWRAYERQRWGAYWSYGCGQGGHIQDFQGAWQYVFGHPGNCTEIYDQYYGNLPLSGLTGNLATYNGLDIMDASEKKSMIEHYLVPGDPGYIGTPSHPGPVWVSYTKANWIQFYNDAVRFGLQSLLPFTLADINAAFP